MNYVLSGYPLSSVFRDRFENLIGYTPEYMTASDLRKLPLMKMLKTLRALKPKYIFIALEDVNSGTLLSILKILASIPNSRSVEIVHPDLRRQGVYRAEGLLAVAELVNASILSVLSALKCNSELKRLISQPLCDVHVNASKKIMHLNANLWVGFQAGGSVGHVAGVVNAFLEKGYPVDCYSAGAKGMVNAAAGYHYIALKTYGAPFELNYYRFHRHLIRELGSPSEGPYSFIYQRMSLGNYSGVVLSRRWNIPLVLEYNGSEAWIAKNWGRPLRYHDLAVLAEEVCFKHAHVIVVISEVLRDELIARGVSPDKIVFYPNCIDPKIFDPGRFRDEQKRALRIKYGISPDSVVAAFLGTFGQWHGTEVMAEAIKQLADKDAEWLRENNVHFFLIGEGYKMHLVKKILSPDYCKRFYTLTGIVSQGDAPAYLAASDILLSPHIANTDGSRFFGSPTKLFEYMAMGKGIVASDLDQIGEVLRNSISVESLPSSDPQDQEGRLSVLVRPGDVNQLITGIKFLVKNDKWRNKLGSNARSEALSKYTWRHHVDAILQKLSKP